MTLTDHIKRIFPFLLLAAYGTFLCSYFIFRDYSDPYRFFARVVFVLGVFVLFGSLREFWRHPLFQVLAFYMVYMLLSGFWSTPFDWYQLGQKLTISIYLLSFIAITHFLIGWDGIVVSTHVADLRVAGSRGGAGKPTGFLSRKSRSRYPIIRHWLINQPQ